MNLLIRMEGQVLASQQQQQSQLADPQKPVAICASVDEPFFDQVALFMLNLSSGFILVVELSKELAVNWQSDYFE